MPAGCEQRRRRSRGFTTRSSNTMPAASASSFTSRAGSLMPSSGRRWRRCAISITAARAAARSTPATARAFSCKRRTRSSRRRPGMPVSLCRRRANTAWAWFICRTTWPNARSARRFSRRSWPGKASASSAGARFRPTTPRSARRRRHPSRSCGRCSSRAARSWPTTWRSSANSTSSGSWRKRRSVIPARSRAAAIFILRACRSRRSSTRACC